MLKSFSSYCWDFSMKGLIIDDDIDSWYSRLPVILSVFEIIFIIITDIIAPVDAMATSPKLSSSEFYHLF